MRSQSAAKINLIVFCLFAVGLCSACALLELKEELNEYHTTFSLSGKLFVQTEGSGPLVAVVYKEDKEGFRIFDYALPDPEGHYAFLVPEGIYFLAAFKDANQNFTYDEGEYFGYANQSQPVVIDARQMAALNKKGFIDEIYLTEQSGYRSDLATYVDISILPGQSILKVGVVTDLDDPIFVQENGYLGYWKPMTFLRDIGVGVYFLQEYDTRKIPVLFVHGANGTPIGWQPLVEQLDRERYQPWFYYYPSGFRIDAIAEALNNITLSLDENYRFKKLVVVAHSMGGLVSRDFILKSALKDKHYKIDKFISISTPWGGVNTAAMGVKQSPVVVPNWIDLDPNSEFIQAIYTNPLPEYIDFYLLFGVRGECSIMMANNDGTIEIASEIDYRAQRDAQRIFAYDEDHDSILKSPDVLERFRELLQ